MKFCISFSALLVILPILSEVSALHVPDAGLVSRQGKKGKNDKGDNNKGDNNKGDNNKGKNNKNNKNNDDLQESLTLDPSVIAKGFSNDGQDIPADGQVASLTSTNNFINFCATVPNLAITNGKQITAGSCNPAPIGVIPSSDNMPSCKFTVPKNGDTIPADKEFTIEMAIKNLETGAFVNAQENYFAAPQQVNKKGLIVGHSHVVVEKLDSLDQTDPTNPKKFAFFKGLNDAAKGGVLTADVTNGLPAGDYRLCSINAAANHQPVIVPIAQHGSLDDCVYFTAEAGGKNNNDNKKDNNKKKNNKGKNNRRSTGPGRFARESS